MWDCRLHQVSHRAESNSLVEEVTDMIDNLISSFYLFVVFHLDCIASECFYFFWGGGGIKYCLSNALCM